MKSAELLQKDVLDELAWDASVDSSGIGVTVTADGVVTLAGRVATFGEKTGWSPSRLRFSSGPHRRRYGGRRR